ncbi:zinc finger, CCHC-type containing protein [Tanacetum coccineum]
MSASLFDIYQNVESSKELWDSLEAKYMAKDASSKKFLVSNITNYKMTYSRPVMEQYNELLDILRRFTQHKMNMDEAIQVSCIIDKLPPFWKDFEHTLKHLKEELTLVELGSHLRIEESLRVQDSDKPKGNNVAGSSVVNMVEHNNSSRINIVNNNIALAFMSTSKLNDSILWHARLCHVHFKRMQVMSKDGLIPAFYMDTKNDLCDMHATPTLRNKKYFVTFIDDASRFYVIEPNESVSINSIIESRDEIFDENIFSSVPRPSVKITNGTEDNGGSVIPEDVKEAINDEMDSIMGNNTWVLVDLPPGFKPLGCKWIFKRKLKVDGTIEKFKVMLVIQGFRQNSGIDYFDTYTLVARISTIRLLIAMEPIHNLIIHQMDVNTTFLNGKLEEEVYMNQPQGFIMPADKCVYSKFDETGKGVINCLYVDDVLIFGTDQVQVDLTKEFLSSSTLMDTSEKLMPNNGQAVSQLNYSRVLKYLKKSIDYNLTYTGYPSILEGYTDASWISNTEDNSSTSGWVFLLGGAAGKEAKWLRTLIFKIPLWSKPITPISIIYGSAATLAKAYSQIYNGKSRHLGVRHNMIHELIMNGVVSIEFVRSQQNLVDHLMKGLARDLVLKSTKGIGIKIPSESNPSEDVSSTGLLISGFLQFLPSAGMLLSGLAKGSGHGRNNLLE